MYIHIKDGYLSRLLRLKSNYSLFDLIAYPFITVIKLVGILLLSLWSVLCLVYDVPKSFINYDYGEKNTNNKLDINRLKQSVFFDDNRVYLNPIHGSQFCIAIDEYFELLAKYIRNDKIDYFINKFVEDATEDFPDYSTSIGEIKGAVIALGLKEVRKLF